MKHWATDGFADGYHVVLYSGGVFVGKGEGFGTLDEAYAYAVADGFADYARITGANGFEAKLRFAPGEER